MGLGGQSCSILNMVANLGVLIRHESLHSRRGFSSTQFLIPISFHFLGSSSSTEIIVFISTSGWILGMLRQRINVHIHRLLISILFFLHKEDALLFSDTRSIKHSFLVPIAHQVMECKAVVEIVTRHAVVRVIPQHVDL